MAILAERSRTARDAANLAHELERNLLSIAESLARGEAPDHFAASMLPSLLERINMMAAFALKD